MNEVTTHGCPSSMALFENLLNTEGNCGRRGRLLDDWSVSQESSVTGGKT